MKYTMLNGIREIAIELECTTTLDYIMFYTLVGITVMLGINIILWIINVIIDEFTEYLSLSDLIETLYFKAKDYIIDIKEHKILKMHIDIFEELYRIDQTKWKLHDKYVEYCNNKDIIRIKFYPWEYRKYRAFLNHKESKPFGMIEKIGIIKKNKAKAKIESKIRKQQNMDSQLRALSEMHKAIALNIKKENEIVKARLAKSQ